MITVHAVALHPTAGVPGVTAGSSAACAPPPGYTGSEDPDLPCGIVGSHTDNLDAVTAYILDPGMFSTDALAGAEGPLANLALTR